MLEVEADREGVKRALSRLLAWPDIARSPQLANFLAYIVERRLDGDVQSIKAYTIAVDVFGRAPNFDPQADPIVRVQARRLRGLLDQYYRGPGADDPLRIQLPIGRYVPDFTDSATEPSARPITGKVAPKGVFEEPPPPLRRRGHVTLSWFVLLVLALGAVAMTYSLATWGPRREQQVVAAGAMQMPRLRIMEFQNLTGDDTLTPTIAALAVELVTDFDPLLIVDVAFGGRGGEADSSDRPDDFVLTGVVRRNVANNDDYQFNAILTDTTANTVVWNWAAAISPSQVAGRSGIDYVAQELILRLGGPRGPLHAKARELLARSDISGQENFYLCGVLFSMYRTAPTAGMVARLGSCLSALPKTEDMNGNVVAARASLLAETPLDAHWSGVGQTERYAQAEEMLNLALKLAPTSSFVWEQLARLYEERGEHNKADSAYGTALQLNAANIDATAAQARHLALLGRLEVALPLARRAIDAVPPLEVPDWFRCVPALAALREGQLAQAKRLASECGRVDTELGPVLLLLVAQATKDSDTLGQVLPRILDLPTFRGRGIMIRLRVRMTDEDLLGRIQTALLTAGVPATSMDNPY